MIRAWCDECGAHVLIWPGDLRGIVNTPRGAIVAFRCGAGHDGAERIERVGTTL